MSNAGNLKARLESRGTDIYADQIHIQSFSSRQLRAAVPPVIRLVETAPPSPRNEQEALALLSAKSLNKPLWDWWKQQTPRLIWQANMEDNQATWLEGNPVDGCLWSFIRLADANGDQILRFAKKYGVLGICKHRLPGTHHGCLPASQVYKSEQDDADSQLWNYECLSDWQSFALVFRTLLEIEARLVEGRKPTPEQWDFVLQLDDRVLMGIDVQLMLRPLIRLERPHGTEQDTLIIDGLQLDEVTERQVLELVSDPAYGERAATSGGQLWTTYVDQRSLMICVAAWLLRLGGITVGMQSQTSSAGPELALNLAGSLGPQPHGIRFWPRNTLFSALAIQLAAVITSRSAVATCSECGNPYQPSRKPRPDRRHYCPDCQEDGNRAAKRRSYHANKGKWPSVLSRKRQTKSQDKAGM